MDDDCKIKPLFIMLSKTSSYVTTCDGETKRMNFLIKDSDYWKNIMILGIKSAMVLKKKW